MHHRGRTRKRKGSKCYVEVSSACLQVEYRPGPAENLEGQFVSLINPLLPRPGCIGQQIPIPSDEKEPRSQVPESSPEPVPPQKKENSKQKSQKPYLVGVGIVRRQADHRRHHCEPGKDVEVELGRASKGDRATGAGLRGKCATPRSLRYLNLDRAGGLKFGGGRKRGAGQATTPCRLGANRARGR